ncbi:MAG: EAL domain-containing protein [Pseudomonadota bacterium]
MAESMQRDLTVPGTTTTSLAAEVAELQANIDRLEDRNHTLERELAGRRQAVAALQEAEERFRQAYHFAPIGMALVNLDAVVFNANPALKSVFWPRSAPDDELPIAPAINAKDRERFAAFFEQLRQSPDDALSDEFDCVTYSDDDRRMVFVFSPVAVDGAVSYFVMLVQDVTETREMTKQLTYQAHFDELTRLMNRRAFTTKLEETWRQLAVRDASHFLLFLDLDQFKVVNDTCGHAAGDLLLKQVADILVQKVRQSDCVARLGGDEFAILLLGCNENIALQRAEDVRRAIQDLKFIWNDDVFRIGVSIGVVKVDSCHKDINELQQIADAACYAAKEAGRNRVHVVDGAEDKVADHRSEMRWVQRLHDAMTNNRFALFGQQIHALTADGTVAQHVEILLRLRDVEERRLIPPGAFLPAAERYGLMLELDTWVVTNLLKSLHLFHAVHESAVQYWVNLSGASISDPGFRKLLLDRMATMRLPPGTINFEITETVVIRSLNDAEQLISELRKLGCKVALDDFGAGLSSFTYLKQLPIDFLKIDGGFVKNILADDVDRIFLQSIVDIARKLNVRTIAEHVENGDVLQAVRALGVDFVQGYGIHRPEVLLPSFPQPDSTGVYRSSTTQKLA